MGWHETVMIRCCLSTPRTRPLAAYFCWAKAEIAVSGAKSNNNAQCTRHACDSFGNALFMGAPWKIRAANVALSHPRLAPNPDGTGPASAPAVSLLCCLREFPKTDSWL